MNTTDSKPVVPAFTYVHRAGCQCSRNPAKYAAQRLSVLHGTLSQWERDTYPDEDRAPEDAYRATEEHYATVVIPDGSCLGWWSGDRGGKCSRPGEHRDHYLLALYRAALALGEAEEGIRAAVAALDTPCVVAALAPMREAAREAEALDLPAYADLALLRHGPASALGRVEHVGYQARQALAMAIITAPWGQQADKTFVTQHEAHIGGNALIRELHLPGRGGVVARVDFERGEPTGALTLYTPVEAAKKAAEQRAARAVEDGAYKALRGAAGAALREGKEFPLALGQKGGFIEVDGRMVSARGALVAAGHSAEAAEGILDAFAQADPGPGEVTYEDLPDGGFISRHLGVVLRMAGPVRVPVAHRADRAGNPVAD